jgi:hypothetical protein
MCWQAQHEKKNLLYTAENLRIKVKKLETKIQEQEVEVLLSDRCHFAMHLSLISFEPRICVCLCRSRG